jgi:nucleoside-diphosphate-sugar epimerase
MLPSSALVTGGTGFVGSHLIQRLLRDGCRVEVLVRDTGKAAHTLPALPKQAIRPYDGTLESLIKALRESRPEVVYHLASYFVAEHRSVDVDLLVESNIRFGTQLLEAMTQTGIRCFVNTGTAWQHFLDDEYNPVCLYAASKQAFEDMLYFYVVTNSIDAITLRLFDTYGPGDSRPKLFPALLRAVRSGEVLRMSPGEQLLDLVYIDDVVDAYVRGYECLRAHHARTVPSFSVSSGAPVTLRQVVSLMAELASGKPNVEWGARPYRAREVMRPWAGGRAIPGWAPRVGLRDGIKRVLMLS